MKSSQLKLTIFVLVLLLALTAVGFSSSATAQSGYYIYAPLVQRDCVGCDPRPTPTPRMWTHWGEQP